GVSSPILTSQDLPVVRYGFSSAPVGPVRIASGAKKPVSTRVLTWCSSVPGSLPSLAASSLLVSAWSRQSRRIRRRNGLASALASAAVASRRPFAMDNTLPIDFSQSRHHTFSNERARGTLAAPGLHEALGRRDGEQARFPGEPAGHP